MTSITHIALRHRKLVVLAWVALWTPIEALATDWFSFYRLRRGYRALLGMDLAVKAEPLARKRV